MIFCSLTKYNDNPLPIRLYTNPWPLNRTRPFTDLWEVSIEHFRDGCSMLAGDNFSAEHLVPPYLGLACILLIETNPFPRTYKFFPNYSLPTSLGIFSILLQTIGMHPPVNSIYHLAWETVHNFVPNGEIGSYISIQNTWFCNKPLPFDLFSAIVGWLVLVIGWFALLMIFCSLTMIFCCFVYLTTHPIRQG